MNSFRESINNFFRFNIVDSLIIIIISIVIYRLLYNFFTKKSGIINNKLSKRNKTYIKVVGNILKYAFIILTILIILQINGINVSSLIAGVGIASVVIGLAIQDALKDIIRGISILSDEYFAVGDVILYNGITGKVVSFGLNSTKMKDVVSGNLITIANRNIEQVQIVSHAIHINIPLPYELKLNDAEKVVNEAIKKISENDNVESCSYKGVNNYKESNIDYLIEVNTHPDNKLQVRRDSLGIILKVLEKNNIAIPYNQLDIHNKD